MTVSLPPRLARLRSRETSSARGIAPFLASTLINTGGDGLYIAASALFFTRGLGLPVAQVGVGLTCAGIAGLSAGVPLGRLADRRGPREVLIGIQLVQALAIAAYVLVGHSLWAFIGVATIFIASMQGADAAKGALVGRLSAEDPVGLRALLQSVSNVGISAGTVLAGFAIASGTHLAYELVMIGDAGSFLGAALLLLWVPRIAPARPASTASSGPAWPALRDGPYLALTVANAVMALQYFVLAFAMPLWVIDHTGAPRWLVSPMLLTNTVLVVLFQVRFSRGTRTPAGGARSIRHAGVVLAVAMVLYSVAAHVSALDASLLLLAAVVFHTVGELLQSAGSFGVSYGLADQSALGEYLGVYGMSIGLCRAIAPGVLAATCLSHGRAGWLLVAGLLLLSGLVTPPLTRWAQADRRADRSEEGDTTAPVHGQLVALTPAVSDVDCSSPCCA